MIESVIENLDGPATIIAFVCLVLVWREYSKLQEKLLEAFISQTEAYHKNAESYRRLAEAIEASNK